MIVKKSIPAKKVAVKNSAVSKYQYRALLYSQRSGPSAPRFLLFHAPAKDIADWADVDRLSDSNKTGAQRPLRELKVGKVARFFRADAKNTIPTAVVIALDEDAISFVDKDSVGCGVLEIKVNKKTGKPGLIIDGQHRVFGALKFSSEMPLNIVAFLGGDDAERAFQFVVINNSAAKVSKDHIKSLNLQYSPEALNSRLISSAGVTMGVSDEKYEDLALLDSSAPFKGLIEWPTNKNGFIAANALEGAIAETRDRAHSLGIETLEVDVFLQIWTKISSLRKAVWKPFPASRLLMKVSIYALTVFILDSMVAKLRTDDEPLDFTDVSTLDALVERLILRIPEEFWTSEWVLKELDTTSGRKVVLGALGEIESNVRFKRTWYDGVGIIDPALLHGQAYKKPKAKAKK